MRAIDIDDTFASWRDAALRALAADIPPEAIEWRIRGNPENAVRPDTDGALPPGALSAGSLSLFTAFEDTRGSTDDAAPSGAGTTTGAPGGGDSTTDSSEAVPVARIGVSRELRELLGDAALFDDPRRWAFLYRVLWRWGHGERHVASAADEDGAKLHRMAKSVRRDKHDMMAYVRFQQRPAPPAEDPVAGTPVAGTPAAGTPAVREPEYVAWYEPAHDILAWGAEHFAQRMGRARWLITTPRGAAFWDGTQLHLERRVAMAADHAYDLADRAQALWLTYYQSIFNPARLNESVLEQQMPVRYWKGLPESRLIPGMVSEARSGARQLAQARAVNAIGRVSGKIVAVDAEHAQPVRETASTLDACRRCALWKMATQAVPGAGPANARIMVIGEQPGDQEDLAGRAFVGPAGQLLDTALRRAGLPREDVYLTNAVKHFKWEPRGKRRLHKTPQQREIEACGHWLDAELDAVRPAVIVTLGATALTGILKRRVALTPYLQAPFAFGGRWVLATYHPAYALRQTAAAQRDAATDAIVAALTHAQALVTAPIDDDGPGARVPHATA